MALVLGVESTDRQMSRIFIPYHITQFVSFLFPNLAYSGREQRGALLIAPPLCLETKAEQNFQSLMNPLCKQFEH